MISVNVLLVLGAFLGAQPMRFFVRAQTIGDVKYCLKRNIGSFTKPCNATLPGKPADFHKCFTDATKHGYEEYFASCLTYSGISDDDSCWTADGWTGRGDKDDTAEFAMFQLLPSATRTMLGPFMECAQKFLTDREGCYAGCGEEIGKISQAFEECGTMNTHKLLAINPLADCISKIATQ